MWYSLPVRHLEGLNRAQKEAVEHLPGPLLIIAGAGAGKTKTITHRIAHLIASGTRPSAILAVTFTNKAAAEMRERILNLLKEERVSSVPLITTFHSLGVRLLREFAQEAGVPRSFAIWDRDDSTRALKRILSAADLGNRFPPKQVIGRISREKGDGVTVERFRDQASSFYEESIAEMWEKYEQALATEGALDFDDLLLRTLLLLAQKPDVLSKIQDRWRHLTIDEYQDTNNVQYDIARLLTGKSQNICAVADLDQLIYSWRGARMENLLSFERIFPRTKTVLLEQNYRSTQTILTAANAIIEKNVNRIPKKLFTSNGTGEAITLFAGRSERDEARYVAKTARELLASGVKASEVAVLFRENFQSRALEEACIAEGIPYRVLGVRFFDRAEVKDVLSYLRAALNPASFTDFARAAGAPSRGIGKTTLDKIAAGHEAMLSPAARAKIALFRELLRRIEGVAHTMRPSETLRFILKESGFETALAEGGDEEKERLANIYELVAHAMRYDALPPLEGIECLLEDAALMSEQDALEERHEAISLMTVHASKGLEFDVVFVTGLEQGLFPSEHEDDSSAGGRDPEEERRLFYVALTRARLHLYLTLAESRLRYGTRELTTPSEFLDDIDPRLISHALPETFERVIR